MRISRSNQLYYESGSVHKFWRCHNRQFLLESNEFKDLYLKCTKYAIEHSSVRDQLELTSFCIMDNHTHMQINYKNTSESLSQFMRLSHARFGYAYNKINNTSGKVANERPKTPLIESPEHCMRVHFYIEANPVKAKKIKLEKLRFYKYSSYGFYAHGKQTEWTHLLTIPKWYLELGKTPKERQRKFRKLFREYLDENAKLDFISKPFIGSILWVGQLTLACKERSQPGTPNNTG